MAVTLGRTNTVALVASTAVQLVVPTAGSCNLMIFNLGSGNLFLRYDQAPTASDPASFKIPTAAAAVLFHVVRGSDGIWVLSDQAGSISVLRQ